MQLPRTLVATFCAAIALSTAATAPASAEQPPRSVTAAATASSSAAVVTDDRQRAEEALAEVVAAFRPGGSQERSTEEGVAGAELTMVMLQLQRHLDALSPADRRLAESYLARPTDTRAAAREVAYGRDAHPTHSCGTRVCVTYATATKDAPPAVDVNKNDVPDQVERTRQIFNNVWHRIVTQGRYRAPLPDRGAPDEGPSPLFDVYLTDIGRAGLYGYCTTDGRTVGGRRVSSGYCVLDDDYARSEYPFNTPTQNLQVTAAHEFFHAVQFAYDFGEEDWFMEGTAAWMEDELYDDVDDNLQYLHGSPLTHPGLSMDNTSALRNLYGSWIWWRYLSERHPQQWGSGLPTIIRAIWNRADDAGPDPRGTYAMQATAQTLAGLSDSFRIAFARFSEVNRHPWTAYDEGRSYPAAPLAASHRVSKSSKVVPWKAVRLRQVSSATVAFLPDRALSSAGWRLQVKVDTPTPTRGSYAQLTLYRTTGTVLTRTIRLDRYGIGQLTVPFNTRSLRSVELTVSNGSTRYECNRGTDYSCEGKPLDNNLLTRFSARLLKQ